MSFLELIVNLGCGIIESLCVAYLMAALFCLINKTSNFNDYKIGFFKFWLFVLVAFIFSRCIHIFLPTMKWLKSVVIIITVSIGSKLVYNIKLYKGIITTILCSAISAILEVISVLILSPFGLNSFAIANNTYYNSLFAIGLAFMEAIIAFIYFKVTKIFNKSLASIDNKLKYFAPQLIAIVVCLFPSMILLILNYYKYSALFIFINLIQLLVVAFVGMYNLKFVVKHENTELELANTITYNETLKKVNEGVRGFKHDMGNIVQAILGYIAINDSEGAKNYCQNLVIGFNDINILSILSPKVIDEPAIYGVVVNKILLARDKNMTLSLDINTSVSEINFPKFELSRILGILLDNAIEAGEQTEEKKLTLNMHHDYNRNVDIIVISNSIEDTNMNVDKIFEKNYSTKEKPSGFGLYEVSKFLKYNPQAYIVTTIDKTEKLFTQTLTINSSLNLISKEKHTKESTVA